ncbi:pyruvate kinase isoform X1 [Nilaparvata lugens]|uniref:pyruvate kinase isoform X1 n=1 Tax=Nilaparvata lugens TaxID=108931 RepID=UPI00193D5791|nr:pyruvate kinase isoform X1 [Nilaparvata lugens]XP_039290494.1 pyruvate kinase isoform X1 [Nilaparvata lugens]XP_039290495.1 pyruvate kinase isoform X1 [Nilaparvata lugens]
MMSLEDRASGVSREPLSKFVCTIGPSSSSLPALESLLEAGMSVALIKSCLMSTDEILQTVRDIREAVNMYSAQINRAYPLALALEIKGQTIHTGQLFEGGTIEIPEGSNLILTTNEDWKSKGSSEKVFIGCPQKMDYLDQGTEINIDNGEILLNVDYIMGEEEEDIVCQVIKGGTLQENKPVQLSGIHLPTSNLTQKDYDDIDLAINLSLDYIFVPSVRNERVMEDIRTFNERRHSNILIVAKLQNKLVDENIENIVKQADAIILVRDALSVEMSGERIVSVMDNICSMCKKLGKPVLLEGGVLSSMSSGKDPSLLEVQDVVTCQRIGFDGFVLGDVTANGSNPAKCLKEIVSICCQAESSSWQSHSFHKLVTPTAKPIDPAQAIALSVVETASRIAAAAVVVITTSGASARLISRYLPRMPVIAVTSHSRVARQLAIWKTVLPYHYVAPEVKDWQTNIDLRLQAGIDLGKSKSIVQPGDPLVLLSNSRPGTGFTNTMRVFYASQADPWLNITSEFINQPVYKPEQNSTGDVVQQCPYLLQAACVSSDEKASEPEIII